MPLLRLRRYLSTINLPPYVFQHILRVLKLQILRSSGDHYPRPKTPITPLTMQKWVVIATLRRRLLKPSHSTTVNDEVENNSHG